MPNPFAKPKAAPPEEAMAATLNPRGMPHRLFDREFPPGVWQDVTEGEANALRLLGWAEIRVKEAPHG